MPFDACILTPGQYGMGGISVPLSETIISGLPRCLITMSSSRVIRTPDNDRSTMIARASQVQSSTTHNTRNRRPSDRASEMKSRLHRRLAQSGARIGLRCQELAYATVFCTPPALLPDRSGRASCSSPQSPLWPAEYQGGDNQTGGVRSPAPAASCARPRHPDPVSCTGTPSGPGPQDGRPDAHSGHTGP